MGAAKERKVAMESNFCPTCNRLQVNCNFCPECGTNLAADSQGPVGLPPPPAIGITIEFPYSTSQALDFAIREARKQASFAVYGKEKRAVYRVTYQPSQMPAVIDLIEYLKGRRLRTVYVDGHKVPWNSVFQFAWCFEKKKKSYRPEYYCYGYDRRERQVNIWGCIHCGLYLFPYAPWHSWGKLIDGDGTWRFDKKRFAEEIGKNLHLYRYCPELDREMLKDLLRVFPERINPNHDKNWTYVERRGISFSFDLLGTSRKLPAIITGVRPEGLGFVIEIGKKLKRRLFWATGGDP